MMTRLSRWRDRVGQALLILFCAATSAFAASTDTARRFDAAAALAPRWAMAGAAALIIGVLVIVIARQGYPAPSIRPDETTATEPPAEIPAAVAGVLAGNGRIPMFVSRTTLIDLADRGVLTMRELPRTRGARRFEVAQVPGTHDLEEHEIAALMIAFAEEGDAVTLSKARERFARNDSRFRRALVSDLIDHGFFEPARKTSRDRVTAIALTFLVLGGIACLPAAAFVPTYGGWTFFVPAGLALAGLAGVLIAASMTPLSDAALVEAARWRGYRRHLEAVATDPEQQAPQGVRSRWIIYGVALGLSHQWSRYLKKHPDAAPPWCVTLQDDGGAFAALIASHAGGGSSGAG